MAGRDAIQAAGLFPVQTKGVVMLVLSREKDESVVITVGSEEVCVSIVDVRGNKVRLGFICSPKVVVDREEVYHAKRRIASQKREPAKWPGSESR